MKRKDSIVRPLRIITTTTSSSTTQIHQAHAFIIGLVQDPIKGRADLALLLPPTAQMILERMAAERAPIGSVPRQGVEPLERRSRTDPHHLLPAPGLVHVAPEQMLAQLVLYQGGDVPQKEGAGMVVVVVAVGGSGWLCWGEQPPNPWA